MSSADLAPIAPRTKGGQAQNAAKSAEKLFEAYTWATDDNPDLEPTGEELVEVRAQRIKLKKAMQKLKGGDL